METLYQEYALVQSRIDELEEKKETLRTSITKYLVENNIEKEKHALGTFTISKKKTYTYPAYVTSLEEEVGVLKEKAKNTGEATCTETPSLRFTSLKIK